MNVGNRSSFIQGPETTKASVFDELTKSKYRFPVGMVTEEDWREKLSQPLNITVAVIQRDFAKFVKDFPRDIIPHQNDEEMRTRATQKKRIQLMKKPRNQQTLAEQQLMHNAPRTMESTFSHSSAGETDSYEGRTK
jgi:uncharacterized glyoxalase superfamily metalloenzyme YdcJ